ncbi:MAG: 4-hydroxy-tetrahydrodipicolinate synthase [Cyanobacteria bacterium]|nr:4-hydroxy-tetrahydrodipicolinate synthase [Cyanobacteriota bacterium]MDW8200797.1 4-hydroxy-tetrahydrodipicolinate synthase [Cyanobacteriota bacterium SKYGB_h_bin112]
MTHFGRVLTALVTPFQADGTVDYREAEKLAAYLVDHGTDAIVVCGTTGESPTLSWDEEYELFRVVQQAVAGKAKVIAGTGSNSTREAIVATQKAATLQLDGTLQVVPYYNKPPQEGLYAHFRAIAEAVPDLPMMLYNVPGRTGQNLLPETIARLAELSNIVAVKQANSDMDQVSQIRCLTPSTFQVYSGDDSLTLPMLALGAVGVVSVASHLVGSQLQQMIQAFEAGNVQTAADIHVRLFPLFKALFMTTNPIPIKAALTLKGWKLQTVRPPLNPASGHVIDALTSVMTDLGLL